MAQMTFGRAAVWRGQWVLFVDEMRIGLWGQVRRVWGIRGIRVVQKVQIVFAWHYLVLGVNTQTGDLYWDWIDRVRQEFLVQVLESWPVDGLIWDNSSSHKGKQVAALGHRLVFLPSYSPELDPVERIFEELRAEIEGAVYPSLSAKQLALSITYVSCLPIAGGSGGWSIGIGYRLPLTAYLSRRFHGAYDPNGVRLP